MHLDDDGDVGVAEIRTDKRLNSWLTKHSSDKIPSKIAP